MSSPEPPRPASHRAEASLSAAVRRLLPPLISVTAVAGVIVLLLVLNSRPSRPGAGPAVFQPSGTPSSTAPSSAAPSSPAPKLPASPSVSPPPVSEPPATQPAAVSKSPVTVLNNSRRSGLAAHVAAEVSARGWPIRMTGNFRGQLAMTTVYYAAGQRGAADELAREFSSIRRVEPRFAGLPGSGLTLVVTRDWSN